MRESKSVVYIGPEPVFRGLKGCLVDALDPVTRLSRLHFQPESAGIRALPCEPQHVRPLEAVRREP